MNASRLKQLIDFLLAMETQHRIQKRLSALNSSLSNLASQPPSSENQNAIAESLKNLRESTLALDRSLSAAQRNGMEEIGALPYFSEVLVSNVNGWLSQNPITPSIASQQLQEVVGKRQQFLESLTVATKSLAALGIIADSLQEGEAELGLTIPRLLFDNELKGLSEELGEINQILRTFAEVAGSKETSFAVKEISTSDPVFTLAMDQQTLLIVAGVIAYFITNLKQLMEIKKLRNETKKVLPESAKMFDEAIKKRIDEALAQKHKELIEQYKGDNARKNELSNALKFAMGGLYSRFERGLNVQINVLPPAKPKDGSEQDEALVTSFAQLQQLSRELEVPLLDDEPLLSLPREKDKKQ